MTGWSRCPECGAWNDGGGPCSDACEITYLERKRVEECASRGVCSVCDEPLCVDCGACVECEGRHCYGCRPVLTA